MANVIYRGPVEREPETINLPVAAALNPGVAVKGCSGKLAAAATLPAAGSSSATVASSARQSPLPTQPTKPRGVPR
jgi:hypothetical protein